MADQALSAAVGNRPTDLSTADGDNVMALSSRPVTSARRGLTYPHIWQPSSLLDPEAQRPTPFPCPYAKSLIHIADSTLLKKWAT